jgi:large subunit ribosomal protein L21
MYAVIKTGGKQYKVAKDQIVVVEKLVGEAGQQVAFEDVLMVAGGEAATVGAPHVAGATVTAEIVEQGRAPKIIVFKKKRRKKHRRRNGHRQDQTVLRITEILTDGKKPAKAKTAAPKAEAKPATAKEEAKAAPKAEAKPATAKEEAKAAPKAKVQTKAKPAAKPKAAPKAKAETAAKAKAAAKPKATPKTKTETKAKAPAKTAAPKTAAPKKAPAKKTKD